MNPNTNYKSILFAIISHTGLGLYVVLSKLLFSKYPPFGLLACGFFFSLLVGIVALRKNFVLSDLKKISVWSIGYIAVFRSVSKMIAVQYTTATNVQLFGLTAPFFTALISRIFLKEKLPSGTILALFVTSLGAFLVTGEYSINSFEAIGHKNLLGMGLALISAIFMAILVIVTNYSIKIQNNPTNVYLQQTFSLVATYFLLSLLTKESWDPFLQVGLVDICLLGLFFIIIFIAGGITVYAISLVNTSIFSILLSLRLVVVLIFGKVVLGETLISTGQYLGAFLVVTILTWYLWKQNKVPEILVEDLKNNQK